ncbi:MAG TPA: hypothetical protein VGO53_00770 [Steroidobacteraceae bacterium]|nr:hypothetical protein [Steroidobacteraceae bacterium]
MMRACIPAAFAAAVIAASALVGCAKPTPVATSSVNAASESPSNEASGYASLGKLPDWSGVWEPMRFAKPGAAEKPPEPPKLTAAYASQFAAFQEKNRTTPGINFVSDVANCVPPGLPGSMQQPYPIEFLFTPGRVTVLIETYSLVRRVYTDGSSMPAELDPSYQGTSVGKWEGDTLVVETAGILPETSPLNGINGHSDKLQITERMRLTEPDVLEIMTTRNDPAVFTEPYTTTARYQRHRDWKIMEYVCAQNNHDALDEHGNPAFSLERKPGE